MEIPNERRGVVLFSRKLLVSLGCWKSWWWFLLVDFFPPIFSTTKLEWWKVFICFFFWGVLGGWCMTGFQVKQFPCSDFTRPFEHDRPFFGSRNHQKKSREPPGTRKNNHLSMVGYQLDDDFKSLHRKCLEITISIHPPIGKNCRWISDFRDSRQDIKVLVWLGRSVAPGNKTWCYGWDL